MISKTISHYKIIENLGEGGMSEVYLAEDLKLERKVAIKFLPQHLTKERENVERFEREAKAAAALNHHNIITIHEISEFDSQIFIVMEYVDGKTLRELIDTNYQFPITNYDDIITQIAEGLSKAHQAGIVHRDIKPENILVDNDGRVKILDFGLAKLKDVSKLTKETSTLGTIHYMSPEQLQGKDVDQRSDIWSLGVVLYEMLTGEVPFQGSYEQAVMYSILNEEPATIKSIFSDIPEYLNSMIGKVLQKKPANRFQSTEELLQVLKTSTISSKQPDRKEKSIIVLPFDDMSPDKDNEYFSDGLTEEIIADLSHIHDLLVISRSSAMTFKGTKKKIKEIVREVNVQYVLEGSVRKAGNNLRITAQLIDATTDAHLWAEKYRGILDDVFDIQEKVSRSIVDALKVIITPTEEKQIAERPIDNVQAYECYLRAMREIQRGSEDSNERALRDLQMGLDIIGDNVLLFAGMGLVYCSFYESGIRVTEETLTKAEEYAFKVLRLEPNSSLSYNLLGRIERFRGSAIKALKHFKQALDIDPNDREALFWLGLEYTWHLGRPDSARPFIEKLIDRDPLSPLNHLLFGLHYLLTGEFDNALKSLNNTLNLEPDSILANFWSAYVLLWSQQNDKAFALINRMAKEESSDQMHKVFTGWLLFLKYALNGEKSKALELLTEDVRNFFWHDADLPCLAAGGFALIDEKKEAIRWLEHVINKGFINYPILVEKDPFLENIRGEERFKKLMERVKHEWENFEV
jgi:serine/threonine protein kinase/Flp pilus assembly protein TadD